MDKKTTTVSFGYTNVLIHVNKIKVTSLSSQKWKRKTWKKPEFEFCADNIAGNSAQNYFARAGL